MFVKIVIFACAFVACGAKQSAPAAPAPTPAAAAPAPTPAAAAPAPAPVLCGEPPSNLFSCIGNVKANFVVETASKKCNRGLSECDLIKCIFRESGWALPGDKVNKAKVAEHLTQYAADHPEWASAVNNLKATCLGDKELPPQGVTLDCAPYDVFHCIMTSFIKNAAPGQWNATPSCAYTRTYAQSCPYCPSSCFAPQVPHGSCSACLTLPRSP